MTVFVEPNAPARRVSHGFTLIEVVFVVLVIALLAAVALPIYAGYRARSQAAELALKYDAIRTNIQVAAKTGDVQAACAVLANTVHSANLRSDYAHLAIDFEPVTGGYTPVLTLCANLANQGLHGVEVTREAHRLLSRNSAISPGALIGESAVSFSVRLAGNAALCLALAPVNAAKSGCGPGQVAGGQANVNTKTPAISASGPASVPAKPPVIKPSQPVVPASGSASQPVKPPVLGASQPLTLGTPSGPKVCPVVAPRQVNRQVMRFGSDTNGRITNAQNLDTHGDMTSFSTEVVITGDARNSPTATLVSYATDRPYTGFSLWGPQSLRIGIAQMHYNTGINVEDGQSHRLTVTWQQAGGTLILYDNGREVWRRLGVNTGGTVGGNGKLMIGQKDESAIWGPDTYKDGYTGSIVAASLARGAVSATQVGSGPMANVLNPGDGLLTHVIMGPNGQPVDTTGQSSYVTAGDVRAQGDMVSTASYVDSNCQ